MRMTGRTGGLLVGLLGLLVGARPSLVLADVTHSVTVSAVISSTTLPDTPNPVVQFSGLAAPAAAVAIERDGLGVATLTAGSNATFSTVLSGQPAGEHVYIVSATDTQGRAHSPVTFALNSSLGSTTIISGVFLGPSIAANDDTFTLGESVAITGMTAPGSSVALTVNSFATNDYTVTADSQGRWQKVINTSDLGAGDHTAQARAVSGATISEFSSSVAFSVNPIGPCDGKKRSDLNCDGQVNLTDFSILLFFWLATSPSNSRANIDQSGRVDVVDFSIMLFEWTG